MSDSSEFDLVIVGAGPGGYVAAIRASQLGMKVACIDKRKALGGTCLNVGCIPSKTLLELSHNYDHAKNHLGSVGIEVGEVSLNLKKVLSKKKQVVTKLTAGIDFLFKKNKVTKFVGSASIVDAGKIVVHQEDGKEEKISCKNIIIATGSEVISLPNVKIDEERIISSTGALDLAEVPKKMIVIGGGVIGLELGSVWSRFGAEVQVIEYADNICSMADQDITKEFTKILTKQGIKIDTGYKVEAVERQGDKVTVSITSKDGSDKQSLEADVVLVAVGRAPNSKSLGLGELGVEIDKRGFIEVNEQFETNVKGIFAIGDVIKGPMLAHKAEEDGVCCVEMMAGQASHVDYNLVPSVIYTHPEVAWVGKNEEELQKENIAYKVGKFSFMANSRAKATLSEEGFVKVLACAKSDKVLGCHIIGREAGNLIHEAVIIMEFGGSAEDLARTIHAHPTFNEAVKEAALAVDGLAIHS